MKHSHLLIYYIKILLICIFVVVVVGSTVASGLNALAAVTVEDFIPLVVTHIPPERETLVSKMLVFVYGVVSLMLAFSISKLGDMILQVRPMCTLKTRKGSHN